MTDLLTTLLERVKSAIQEGIVEVGGNYIRTATGQIGLDKRTFRALGWGGLVQENVTKLLQMAQEQLSQQKQTTEPTNSQVFTQAQETQIPITGLPPEVVPVYQETTQTATGTIPLNTLLLAGAVLFLLNEAKL